MMGQYKNYQELFESVLLKEYRNACSATLLSSLVDEVYFKLDISLPQDYIAFLQYTNGYNDGYLKMYGSHSVFCKKTRRLICSVLDMNLLYFHFMDELVIGEYKHTLFGYSPFSQQYVWMTSDGIERSNFPSLLDLFNASVGKKFSEKNKSMLSAVQ